MGNAKVLQICSILIVLLLIRDATSTSDTKFPITIWNGPNDAKIQGPMDQLFIFCYESHNEASLLKLWTTVAFKVATDADYKFYKQPTAEEVIHEYKSSSYFFDFWGTVKPWLSDDINVTPFNSTCIGVKSTETFSVRLIVKKYDYRLIACLIAGLVLFFLAPKLSGNVIFHYGTGVSFGLLASALIVIFVISRFFPKKGAYTFLAAGFSISAFILQSIWTHISAILESYSLYVLAYFVVAGCISLAVCYYKGPVTNPRLLNIIQWTIQSLAVGLIYAGCQLSEVSLTLVIACILIYNMPSCGISKRLLRYWHRFFPPKIHLLTEQEYIDQGERETRKALEELKAYCSSPECNAWKTIGRLKSPNQFAEWIGGNRDHSFIEDDDDDMNTTVRSPSLHMLFEDDDDDISDSDDTPSRSTPRSESRLPRSAPRTSSRSDSIINRRSNGYGASNRQ